MRIGVFILLLNASLVFGQNLDSLFYSYKENFIQLNPSKIKKQFSINQNAIKVFSERVLYEFAYIYAIDRLGQHEDALVQLEQIDPGKLDQTPFLFSIYHGITASIQYNSENPEEAISELRQAIEILPKGYYPITEFTFHLNAAVYYNASKNMEMAFNEMKKAEKILLSNEIPIRAQLYFKLNYGMLSSEHGQLENAKQQYQQAQALMTELNDSLAFTRTLANLGDILLAQDSIEHAKRYFFNGLKRAQSNDLLMDEIHIHHSLYKLYKSEKNTDSSLHHYLYYDSLRNFSERERSAPVIQKLKDDYKIKLEKNLRRAKALQLRTEKSKNLILLLAISVLSALLIIISWLYVQIRIKNKVLIEKQQEEIKRTNSKPSNNKVAELDDKLQALIPKLEELIYGKKIFVNPNLNQEKLAKKIGTNRTYLTQLIKLHYDKGYTQWINELRIKEAKRQLADPQNKHLSIEGISQNAGFSSISSFNSLFKKQTGLTPSYFRKNIAKY